MRVPSLPVRRRTLPALLFVCLGWLTPLATSHAESPRVDPHFVLTPRAAPLEDPPPNQARLYVVREQYLRLARFPTKPSTSMASRSAFFLHKHGTRSCWTR